MTFRIGIFFFFIGVMGMWIYFVTDFAESPSFWLLFASLGCFLLGIYLMRKGYAPPPPSERFRLLRRLRNRGQDENEGSS